jgi:protein-S-isoprenylcysteine O-methyltransferase Ste14
MNNSSTIEIIAFGVIMLSWVGFTLAFILRGKPQKTTDRKRDPSSIMGIVVQGLGFAFVWFFRRPLFGPFAVQNNTLESVLLVIAMLVAVFSVLMVVSAVQTLGKEWSLTARVVEGHKLATEGAYNVTRNPIYTAMLGMLIATGLVLSSWIALGFGLLAFFVGTYIRVRSEERLLEEAFGSDFQAYKKRVPVLIPGIF